MTEQRICKQCGKSFKKYIDKRRPHVFCSWNCYMKYRYSHLQLEFNTQCEVCGKKFRVKPYVLKIGRGKLCSLKCYHEKIRNFVKKPTKETSGELGLLRISSTYREWRKKVLQLKGEKCEVCGTQNKVNCQTCGHTVFLHVHHIKSFALYPELRFDLNNGQVLCQKCHSHVTEKGVNSVKILRDNTELSSKEKA